MDIEPVAIMNITQLLAVSEPFPLPYVFGLSVNLMLTVNVLRV